METHLLRLYAVNSMGLITAAVIGAAAQLSLPAMLLSRLVCIVCSWVVVLGLSTHKASAASRSSGQSNVIVGMHMFATALALAEVLRCAVTEMRERALFITQLEHDQGQRTFLASLAHELRTPLHGIGGMLHSLTGWNQTAQLLPGKVENWVGVANECSVNLLQLLNDVLDLTKSELGQLTLGREPFNLRAAIQYCTDVAGVSLKVRRGAHCPLRSIARCSCIHVSVLRHFHFLTHVHSRGSSSWPTSRIPVPNLWSATSAASTRWSSTCSPTALSSRSMGVSALRASVRGLPRRARVGKRKRGSW
jgi:signal transduction histidine kinase